MGSIRKKDTRPELALRGALSRAGIRGWRCNVRLPAGSVDIVFTRWKVAVFCDGVWWHGHPDYLPHGRRGSYWDAKIASNVARDRKVARQLRRTGWSVVRIWDIDVLSNPDRAARRVIAALRGRGRAPSVRRKL